MSLSGVETVDDMLAFVRGVIRKKTWATISDHAVDVVKRVVMAACGVSPHTVIRGGPLRDGLFFYELPKKYSCAVALEGGLTFIKLADRDPDAEVTICAAASSSELGIMFRFFLLSLKSACIASARSASAAPNFEVMSCYGVNPKQDHPSAGLG